MKRNETIINRTNDYGMFKRLEGNREVNPKRVKQIKKSIEEIGYIRNPIIVNEKYEVIDGQGRLQALMELGKPIEYIVQPGLGIKECLYMNINQEKWQIIDYVKSYAERGNENYKRLLDLLELYPLYKLTALGSAVKGLNLIQTAILKRGDLEVSTFEYEQAIIKLNYVNRFIPFFKHMPGKITNFAQAIVYTIAMENIDKERLYNQITKNVRSMTPWNDLRTCLQSIEEVYNNGLGGKNRVYIYTEYRKALLDNPQRRKGTPKGYKVGDNKINYIKSALKKGKKQ